MRLLLVIFIIYLLLAWDPTKFRPSRAGLLENPRRHHRADGDMNTLVKLNYYCAEAERQ